MDKNKKPSINWIYKVIALILILSVILIPLFRIDGGLVDDDFYYIKIAESLPNYNLAIFPIGYPVVLRITNLIFNDYFISSRIVSIFSFIFILIFSYHKNFFFKETLLLMSFKFFTLFFYALSETIFISVFYIVFYVLYNLIINKKDHFLLLGISIFLLVMIRYSGLFLWGGIFIYTIINYFFYDSKKITLIGSSLTKSLFLSFILIALFLIANLYFTNSFFGENLRDNSLLQGTNGVQYLLKSIMFPFYIAINPISEVFRFSFFSFIFTFILASFFSGIILILFFKNINKLNRNFLVLSITIMIVYFLGLIYSSYKTGIEAMHFRLNAPIVFVLFFITIIIIKDRIGRDILIVTAFFSISINLFFNINNSFDYLEKRLNVISFYQKMKCPNYYSNDIQNIPTETGGVLTSNFFTIYCINPNVKQINKNKKENLTQPNVVYEKQLVNVKPINRTTYSNSFSITK